MVRDCVVVVVVMSVVAVLPNSVVFVGVCFSLGSVVLGAFTDWSIGGWA
jgi:hypothetical protein